MTVMKRTAIALLLCLLAFAATAQNVTVIGPITPGHCAAFSSTTVIKDCGGVPPVGPGTSVVNDIAIFNNTTGSLLADAAGFSITPGGPLTVNPTANTMNQGLLVTQTSPTGAGPFAGQAFNLLDVTYSSAVSGSGNDGFGLFNRNLNAVRSNMTLSGANLAGSTFVNGLFATRITSTASVGDVVGLAGTVYTNVRANITGFMEAINPYAFVDAGGQAVNLVSAEINSGIATGGLVTNHITVAAVSSGTTVASGVDAAYAIGNLVGAGGARKTGIVLTNIWGFAPLATTGDFFAADTAYTIANFINLNNLTVTGNYIAFANFSVAGPTGNLFTNGILTAGNVGSANGALTLRGITSGSATLTVNATATLVSLNQSFSAGGTVSATGLIGTGSNGGVSGQINMAGSTSGTVIQTVQPVAGTPTITWGTNSGTPAVTASAPLAITAATGNITLGTVPVANGGTNYTGGAWTSYSPTMSCGTGSGTWGTTTGFFITIGKFTMVRVSATLTTASTCATSFSATLPNTAATTSVQGLYGQESSNNGKTIRGNVAAAGTTVQGKYYDNTYTAANGDVYLIQGVYENQ